MITILLILISKLAEGLGIETKCRTIVRHSVEEKAKMKEDTQFGWDLFYMFLHINYI